jgi:diadenosine tetraphosphatase ApaH/serine/threonine PP2A family protein phosphatase
MAVGRRVDGEALILLYSLMIVVRSDGSFRLHCGCEWINSQILKAVIEPALRQERLCVHSAHSSTLGDIPKAGMLGVNSSSCTQAGIKIN